MLTLSDVKLLSECKVETYRASGNGGQHVNTTESAVRLTHLPTGLVSICQQERSQYLNKRICLERLRKKIERLNDRPAKRIATKRTRSSQIKRLDKKKKRSDVKHLRGKPSREGFG